MSLVEYATLDGVVLQDLSTQTDVMVTNLVGLSGFTSVRGDVYDRPDGAGAVEPANQYLPAGVSAWDIAVSGTTPALARAGWTSLLRTLNACRRQQKQLRWRWVGDTLELQSNVRVAGMTPPVFSNSNAGSVVAFQVLLRSADPAHYTQATTLTAAGAPSVSIGGFPFPAVWPVPWGFIIGGGSGTVTVTNDGDEEAWPVIDIAGPITSPVIQNQASGKSIYFDGLVVALGETLSVDLNPASFSASIGGVSKKSSIRFSASQLFSVAAGASEGIAFSGTGTDTNTTMTVSLRSAYLT